MEEKLQMFKYIKLLDTLDTRQMTDLLSSQRGCSKTMASVLNSPTNSG